MVGHIEWGANCSSECVWGETTKQSQRGSGVGLCGFKSQVQLRS